MFMRQATNQHTDRFETVKVCPVCGSCLLKRKFEVRHVKDDPQHSCALELGFAGATVVACGECSFLFKLQRPPSAYLHEHYAESGEDYLVSLAEEHSGIREDFRVARQLLTEAFPKGGMILDIGCASGFFLESLGGNWKRFGIELFHLAAERARKRPGLSISECDLGAAEFPAQSFDVICSFDVLEHLANPMPIFLEARRILKPGGWLLLGTGDSGSLAARLSGSRWTYLCLPEHLCFFNSNSLRRGLAQAGFSVSRFERIHHGERSYSVATGWIRGVGKHWAIELFGENVIRLGIFRQKTSEFFVPYFFDHMICVAQ
jgi:SAM-dependent methyltransferase